LGKILKKNLILIFCGTAFNPCKTITPSEGYRIHIETEGIIKLPDPGFPEIMVLLFVNKYFIMPF